MYVQEHVNVAAFVGTVDGRALAREAFIRSQLSGEQDRLRELDRQDLQRSLVHTALTLLFSTFFVLIYLLGMICLVRGIGTLYSSIA